MNAPRLVPFLDMHDDTQELPAIWRDCAAETFVVAAPGEFGGIRYRVGDMLVCRGDADSDELVVLVARRHERPRVGWVRREGLEGEHGEPCSPVRWRPAGRVVAVLQPRTRGLAMCRPAERPAPTARTQRAEAPQLSLFSQAA